MNTEQLKRDLRSMGATIYKDKKTNKLYISRADAKKIVADKVIDLRKHVKTPHRIRRKFHEIDKPESKEPKKEYVKPTPRKYEPAEITVDHTYEEIMKDAHGTYSPGNYYKSFDKMPEHIQDAIKNVKPEVEISSYTVHEPTVFSRLEVTTSDNAVLKMEYHLGKIDEVDEDFEGDEDEYYESVADELYATSEWHENIYIDVIEEPDTDIVEGRVNQLKKDLKSMGATIYKNKKTKKSYIKWSDAEKILAKWLKPGEEHKARMFDEEDLNNAALMHWHSVQYITFDDALISNKPSLIPNHEYVINKFKGKDWKESYTNAMKFHEQKQEEIMEKLDADTYEEIMDDNVDAIHDWVEKQSLKAGPGDEPKGKFTY